MSKFKPGQTPHNKGKGTEAAKMVKALSTIGGYVTGLKELDIPSVIEGPENLEYWAKKTREVSRALNQFAKKLKKGIDDAAAERAQHQSDQSQSGGIDGTPDCAASPIAGTAGASGEETRP